MTSPVVYRVFDAADRLIYIGSTVDLTKRMANHRSSSWWSALTARTETEAHPTISDARLAEAEAIRRDHPAFNHEHTGRDTGPGWDSPMSLTAEELDVCRAWLSANRYRVAYLPHRLRWVAKAAA